MRAPQDALRAFGLRNPFDTLLAQRGHLFVWVPVFLGIGIGIYFALPKEPGPGAYMLIGLAALGLAYGGWRGGARLGPLAIAMFLVLAGVLVAGARAHLVAAPQLSFRYYGPIEGRVVAIDRSQSDKMRLTLDHVALANVAPARTPARVRVSLHGDQRGFDPAPGMVVMLTGHLSPPQGPVEPGGFAFQRYAWFHRIGAVGYTRTPALELSPARGGDLLIYRFRRRLSDGLQAALPGDVGAFAAAILTGDRSGMDQATIRALRASNLAHLLAISGLHMGLLTGFVFAALRYALALVPFVALRWPVRKIAAGGALLVAAFYLALSGGNVATERAFVMVAVMLVAVLLNRRALTLRAVALAALIVLLRRPEALMGPGFQMSFAATVALVASYGWIRNWEGWALPRLLRPPATVVMSSFVAGMATAPFAAAHFNQIAHYGLLANLLSVPVMGIVVIPAAAIAALLYPLGLSFLALAVMGWGIRWILGVARWVAGLDGAVSHVAGPPGMVLPLLALAALWLVLWPGRARMLGVAGIVAAFGLWAAAERPALLISDSGGLIGVMGPQGRALSKPKGEGFVATNWLENDGDATPQTAAFARAGFHGSKGRLTFALGQARFVQLSGRGALARLEAACAAGRWVILTARAQASPRGDCTLFDSARLRRTGTLAIYAGANGLRVISARQAAGARLWNTQRLQRKALGIARSRFAKVK